MKIDIRIKGGIDLSKYCNASKSELMRINCQKDPEFCRMCCTLHTCEHNWKTRNVWKECDNFDKGICKFVG